MRFVFSIGIWFEIYHLAHIQRITYWYSSMLLNWNLFYSSKLLGCWREHSEETYGSSHGFCRWEFPFKSTIDLVSVGILHPLGVAANFGISLSLWGISSLLYPESNQRSGQLLNISHTYPKTYLLFAIISRTIFPHGNSMKQLHFPTINGAKGSQGIEVGPTKAGSSSWNLFLRFGMLPLPRCAAYLRSCWNWRDLLVFWSKMGGFTMWKWRDFTM